MKVLLAPAYDLAKDIEADATVEAEYGKYCIEGSIITLAHHDDRSANPAPCNTPNIPVLQEDATILVAHLDIDTLIGVMELQGIYINDPEFKAAAEYIDVNGTHHMHELPEAIQDKFNAIYAFEAELRKTETTLPKDVVTDVTERVQLREGMFQILFGEPSLEQQNLIQKGQEWHETVSQSVEACLLSENENVRLFQSNGVFCSASYYSPNMNIISAATVTYNEKTKAITLGFEDGGQLLNAKEIVQELWGQEAGGREGIAGSPRGVEMTLDDAKELAALVEERLELARNEQDQELDDGDRE